MRAFKFNCYKGTRILLGNGKRDLINSMIEILIKEGYTEINFPIIQAEEIFQGKVGTENNNLMYKFKDRGNRDLCLAPEYTAPTQALAKHFKQEKDIKFFYVQECFRGEKPQAGRYRQFTQLGVEIINPTEDYLTKLSVLAHRLIKISDREGIFPIDYDVTRGLDYYKEGKGFEISAPVLGSSKQVCGGGEYKGGVGFAIGIDRLI